MRSAVPYHRLSRRALRRRQLRRNLAWVVSLFFLAAAFVGGFFWQRVRSERPAPGQATPESASQAQQREARRLLDEAVRARYEERGQGAMNALTAARRADPNAPGLNILVGEIALEQQDRETLRLATREALRRDGNQATAKLLSALETWMGRGESGVDRAGPLARQILTEAAESEPSNAAVYFFHGELSRLLGDSGAAQRNLLLALRRQVPWTSSALLEVKVQLAAREALESAQPVVGFAPGAQAQAVIGLRDALSTRSGVKEAAADLVAVSPSAQTIVLLDDEALRTENGAIEIETLRSQLTTVVSRGEAPGL